MSYFVFHQPPNTYHWNVKSFWGGFFPNQTFKSGEFAAIHLRNGWLHTWPSRLFNLMNSSWFKRMVSSCGWTHKDLMNVMKIPWMLLDFIGWQIPQHIHFIPFHSISISFPPEFLTPKWWNAQLFAATAARFRSFITFSDARLPLPPRYHSLDSVQALPHHNAVASTEWINELDWNYSITIRQGSTCKNTWIPTTHRVDGFKVEEVISLSPFAEQHPSPMGSQK